MKTTLHLVPPSIHAKRPPRKEGEPRKALTDRDFEGFSGRVVTLQPLDFMQCEAANMEALGRLEDGQNAAHLHHLKQVARLKAALVGVSEPQVDPDIAVPSAATAITDEQKAGAGQKPRRFESLFTPKDLLILKEWDGKHHSVTTADAEAILGKAILSED